MSIHIVVFVSQPSLLPAAEAWKGAAARAGFDFSVEGAFDPLTHKGGLPVKCNGIDAAFEYYCDPIGEYLADVEDLPWWRRILLRRFRAAVDFVTHSRMDDRFAAIIGAASLAHAARGLLLDTATGKWISHSDALQWARGVARPPSAAMISGREETLRAIRDWAAPIVSQLGYEPLVPPPEPFDRPGEMWFIRDGKAFRHEFISIAVGFDDDESWLNVTFFATPFPLNSLKRRRFTEIATGWKLWQAMANALNREDDVLPPNVAVDPQFAASPTAEQLRREIVEVDPLVFPVLRKSVEDDGEWWPDAPRE